MLLIKFNLHIAPQALFRVSAKKLIRHTNHLRFQLLAQIFKPAGVIRSFSNSTKVLQLDKQDDVGKLTKDSEENSEEDGTYSRDFVDMRIEDFKELYEFDETGSLRDQIEVILKEYEYHKYNSFGRVPSAMDVFDMSRILNEGPTPSLRMKMFNLFFKREMAKRAEHSKREREKALKKSELSERYDAMEKKFGFKGRTGLVSANGQLLYGLWHNSLFSRIPENRLKLSTTTDNLIRAALFGKKIVFDFDFEDNMSVQSIRSSMEQLQEAYGMNRFQYTEPFDLWFCNFNPDAMGSKYLANNSMRNLNDGSMITIKNDCFTKHFDRNRLVYLTPDSRIPLTDIVKSDDIFIIGVYNDRGQSKPLTYRKAESMGIRSRCLPLDSHIAWQGGSKSLCMNHVLAILLEVHENGGDWKSALLKCLPRRKVKPIEVLKQEEEYRRKKIKKKRFNLKLDLDW